MIPMIFECPRCHNLNRIIAIIAGEPIKCKFCHCKFEPNGKIVDKPPLGAKPCHIHAEQRIEDLSNAILRNIGSGKSKYDLIRKWAKEIVLQCDLAEIVDGNDIKIQKIKEDIFDAANRNG